MKTKGWTISTLWNMKPGLLINVFVGIVGVLIGSLSFHQIFIPNMPDFTMWSFLLAFMGVCVLLTLPRLAAKGRKIRSV